MAWVNFGIKIGKTDMKLILDKYNYSRPVISKQAKTKKKKKKKKTAAQKETQFNQRKVIL